jgi:hypothetical protein
MVKVSSQSQTINGDFNLDGSISVNVQTPGLDPKQAEAIFRNREFQMTLHKIIKETAETEIKKLKK